MARPPSDDPLVREDRAGNDVMAVFARDVTSPSEAREWLARFLSGRHVSPGVAVDAALVLSELVTNALRHGLGDIVARGSVGGGNVRLSVTDSGAEMPRKLSPALGQVGGLGLHVVEQVADTWGVSSFPGGKTVWATLRLTRP